MYFQVDKMTAERSGVLVDLVNTMYGNPVPTTNGELILVPVTEFNPDRVRYVSFFEYLLLKIQKIDS